MKTTKKTALRYQIPSIFGSVLIDPVDKLFAFHQSFYRQAIIGNDLSPFDINIGVILLRSQGAGAGYHRL